MCKVQTFMGKRVLLDSALAFMPQIRNSAQFICPHCWWWLKFALVLKQLPPLHLSTLGMTLIKNIGPFTSSEVY